MSKPALRLTLNDFVVELRKLPADMEVHLPGSAMLTVPSALWRHRRALPDMAISAIPSRYGPMLAGQLADLYENGGQVHGGGEIISDESRSAPLWTSSLGGEATFVAVTGLEIRKRVAVIKTTNLAITQGPSLQRISDKEALRRQAIAAMVRIPDFHEIALPARHWLLRRVPQERSTVIHRLAESRQELANIDARRAELGEAVEKHEAEIAELDYVLGMTDEMVAATPEPAGISLGSIVKTADQFAALPVGTVLMFGDGTDIGQAAQKSFISDVDGACWYFAGKDFWDTDEQMAEDEDEYVVIWLPALKKAESHVPN